MNNTASIIEKRIDLDTDVAASVMGVSDIFARKLEKAFGISLILREDSLRILGPSSNVDQAASAIGELVALAKRGREITQQEVNYLIAMQMDEKTGDLTELDGDYICHTVSGKPVKPKTLGQKKYADAIKSGMITFGIGPAGTGKTYLAMAMAVTAFRNEEVSRIILTRPAIEAGEKLGFLPGDLQSKIDPYLRPLYDALYQIMGAESFQRNAEKGLIEVAPLAYMRGRTLDNAFIILDEAQNTTQAQMKMFLTRIGFGSKAVITGDTSQKDLPYGVVSGLDIALEVLKDVPEIGVCKLTSKDIVRHPLVQKIVEAYEKFEKRHKAADGKKSSGRKKK